MVVLPVKFEDITLRLFFFIIIHCTLHSQAKVPDESHIPEMKTGVVKLTKACGKKVHIFAINLYNLKIILYVLSKCFERKLHLC